MSTETTPTPARWTPDYSQKWDVLFNNEWQYWPSLRGVTIQQIRDFVDSEFADGQVLDDFFDLDFYSVKDGGIPIYASPEDLKKSHVLGSCYLAE